MTELEEGEQITYARLRFTSLGCQLNRNLPLVIDGALQESPTTFSQYERPSQKLPGTQTCVEWTISDLWIYVGRLKEYPFHYYSPNIAPVLNEILDLPAWGAGDEGKTLILTIRNNCSTPDIIDEVYFMDYWSDEGILSPARLEIYRTVYDTFIGKELLGRVSDTGATINLYSLIDTDTRIVYGTSPGVYPDSTACHADRQGGHPLEITLENLAPDTRYYYRLLFRKAGEGDFQTGDERSFHTQRSRGSTFAFAIQADEHLLSKHTFPVDTNSTALLDQTIQNIAQGDPDFLISLGDFGIDGDAFLPGTKYGARINKAILLEIEERHLRQRKYLGAVTHSIPFYQVIGNHEGEQGWCYDGTITSPSALLMSVRKDLIPNPQPDDFYSGNIDSIPDLGLREDYYAWEWGDALFVALDPFWYSTSKPYSWNGPGTANGWDWTLGRQQYDWLYETLRDSDARWKFVLIHHLTSTTLPGYYGRGG